MRSRLAALPIALALLLALAPWTAGARAEATQASGFIVDTGEGDPVYVVVTSDGPERAIDLLRRADLGAVTVDFGGLGAAVCEIRSTGCDVGTCRKRLCQTGDRESPFWQYWRQGPDGWALSPLGASDVEPANEGIAAWVWIGTAPDLPPITWPELAKRAGAPEAVVNGDIGGEPAVYASATEMGGDAGSVTDTLAAGGVLALVVLAGGALVARQRRARVAA
jgi:hypothetical protein